MNRVSIGDTQSHLHTTFCFRIYWSGQRHRNEDTAAISDCSGLANIHLRVGQAAVQMQHDLASTTMSTTHTITHAI
jgi:hypothetical protein